MSRAAAYVYDVLLTCGCVVRKELWTPIPHHCIEMLCPEHGLVGLDAKELLQVQS